MRDPSAHVGIPATAATSEEGEVSGQAASLASSVKTDGRASTARCLASPRGRAASVEQRPSQRTISSRTKDAELPDSPPGISCADRSARSAHRAASATSSLTPLVLPTYHRLPPLAHRRRRAQNKKGNPLKQLHSGTRASVLRPVLPSVRTFPPSVYFAASSDALAAIRRVFDALRAPGAAARRGNRWRYAT
jgi:hypothetical protein